MGCPDKTLARMMRNRAEHPDSDYWTDRIIDVMTRATEWDADRWGFTTDTWMAAERAEMGRRADAVGPPANHPG